MIIFRRPEYSSRTRLRTGWIVPLAGVAIVATGVSLLPAAAGAAEAPVGLGTSASYSVLGGQTVTNSGPSILSGDLGVSPGTAITGFPPGLAGGSTHAGDTAAAQAQSDVVIAYDDTASRAPTANVAGDLVGQTLTAGVYKSTGPIAVSGTLTLDGQGNPNSVFIFQVASTLITASASHISTINGAQACHIYWQVASSAILGTASEFQGTVLALTSISVTNGTTVKGRALARNGQVSLENNVFTAPTCDSTLPTSTPPSTTAPASSNPASSTPGGSTPGSSAPGGGPSSTGQPATGPARSGTTSTGSNVLAIGTASNGAGTGTGGGAGTATSADLANTGAVPLRPLQLGTLLFLIGAALTIAGRRRTLRRH